MLLKLSDLSCCVHVMSVQKGNKREPRKRERKLNASLRESAALWENFDLSKQKIQQAEDAD